MTTYLIRIVPKLLPESEGQWVEAEYDGPLPRRWRTTEAVFSAHIPDTHHLAEVLIARWQRNKSAQPK
jgi:hypothetical protein